MRGKQVVIMCLLVLSLLACQRFERPMERTGLDKDSHTYSFMGYEESRMKNVALAVKGVRNVSIEYNGKRLMMYVIPDESVHPRDYRDLANRVFHEVNRATSLTPFHVKILPPVQPRRSQTGQ